MVDKLVAKPAAVDAVTVTWCQIDDEIAARHFNNARYAALTSDERSLEAPGAMHHIIPKSTLKKVAQYINTLADSDFQLGSRNYHNAFCHLTNRNPQLTKKNVAQEVVWNHGNLILGPQSDRLDDAQSGEEWLLNRLRNGKLEEVLAYAAVGMHSDSRGTLHNHFATLLNAANELDAFVARQTVDSLKRFLTVWEKVLRGGLLVGAFSRRCSEANYEARRQAILPKVARPSLAYVQRKIIELQNRAKTLKGGAELEKVRAELRGWRTQSTQENLVTDMKARKELHSAVRRVEALADKYFLRAVEFGGYTTNSVQASCETLSARCRSASQSLAGEALENVAFAAENGG
jgi:hypothetical protein